MQICKYTTIVFCFYTFHLKIRGMHSHEITTLTLKTFNKS